jgi:glycine betaine catabolism B
MELVVKQTKKEAGDVLCVLFKKPKRFSFYCAQFIDISFPDINYSRIYSLSSSPTEDYLMITFKPGISEHKKKLMNLKPGDKITITHPNGTYTLDESSPAVMLAGGVGIAPHRSMIKFAVDNNLNIPITLIYSNTDSNFPFKKEFDSWQKLYPKFNIYYMETSKSGRVTKEKLSTLDSRLLTLDTIYYLAGPPSFVEDMDKILTQLGVDRVNIRLDSFDGY